MTVSAQKSAIDLNFNKEEATDEKDIEGSHESLVLFENRNKSPMNINGELGK